MKPLLSILCCIFLFPLFCSAQQRFALRSSSWYYDANYGVFHTYVPRDTLIQGKACAVVTQEAITAAVMVRQGFHMYNLPTRYLYSSGDTVFVFNRLFNRFTPLYVFNVSAGDTVRLPIMDVDAGRYQQLGSDSNFYFVVDSVKPVRYDTSLLKTVYSHSLGNVNGGGSPMLAWGRQDSLNIYAERIGGTSGLMPRCKSCIMTLDMQLQFPNSINCYQDISYVLKLISGPCDEGINVGVPALMQHHLDLYPNPAADICTITAELGTPIQSITLYAGDGRRCAITCPNNYTIPVRSLTSGIYLVEIKLQNSEVIRRKLLVQH